MWNVHGRDQGTARASLVFPHTPGASQEPAGLENTGSASAHAVGGGGRQVSIASAPSASCSRAVLLSCGWPGVVRGGGCRCMNLCTVQKSKTMAGAVWGPETEGRALSREGALNEGDRLRRLEGMSKQSIQVYLDCQGRKFPPPSIFGGLVLGTQGEPHLPLSC